MPSWKFSTFDLYFDIDIRSEANIVRPNSLSPCDISNHHGRGRTSERELQKTLIALSLENINGVKKNEAKRLGYSLKREKSVVGGFVSTGSFNGLHENANR